MTTYSVRTVGIASGFSASDPIAIGGAEHVAINFPSISNGSIHAYNIQGALVPGANVASHGSNFANISRANGSLMTATGPACVALTPDLAMFGAVRAFSTSALAVPAILTIISKMP